MHFYPFSNTVVFKHVGFSENFPQILFGMVPKFWTGNDLTVLRQIASGVFFSSFHGCFRHLIADQALPRGFVFCQG